MPLAAVCKYSPEKCIQRAEALIEAWPSATELLHTYKQVLEFQISFWNSLQRANLSASDGRNRLPVDFNFHSLLPQFQTLLGRFSRSAQSGLKESAENLRNKGSEYFRELLRRQWENAGDEEVDAELFFGHAFLQPIAEYFAHSATILSLNHAPSICPYCFRKPVCGVLRPEGDGAKRSLICGFCGTEWEYRRMLCPACEQEDVNRLPVYTAETSAHIRIEGCDACHTFIKTIDLTKDGRAVPVVDEIASLPLTLWAQEKGYEKLQRNLLLM